MARTTKKKVTARQLAIEAARVAHDRHGTDILVLDLRGISPVTDYFVIATGTSDRQMRSVAEEISEWGAARGHRAHHIEGLDSPHWILLDFFDVVVHLFDETHRRYYDLELIWGDAPKIRWRRRAASPAKEPGDRHEPGRRGQETV